MLVGLSFAVKENLDYANEYGNDTLHYLGKNRKVNSQRILLPVPSHLGFLLELQPGLSARWKPGALV
jgi:hypothetical protein